MKFSCEKALLQNAINTTSRAVSPKSAIPALEGILLEADHELRLTGYNLETGIRTTVPAEIKTPGTLILGARLFGEIIRKLPDDIVVFTAEHYMVNIKCGLSEFNILGTNETRPIHTGALFELEDKELTMVAVDGYRLALRRESVLEKTGEASFSFVVPGAALNEVEKICAPTEEPVTVAQGARHIQFKVGNTILVSRRLEGEFLAWRQAIPRNNSIQVQGETKALLAAIDRVSLIISDKLKSPLRCIFDDNMLKISTKTAIGDASDQCPIQGSGSGLEIGFNNKYLMDALKAAPAERVQLELTTGVSPCVILPAEGEENFLYMVLPVRLKAGE